MSRRLAPILGLLLVMVVVLAGAIDSRITRAAADADPVIVGAGDIASCGTPPSPGVSGAEVTAKLLDAAVRAAPEATVYTTGDNAYESGTADEYKACYDPTWGRHKARTRPSAGNHEYATKDAAGYYNYFGAAAGERGKGYYGYDLGTWRVIALNSNCGAVGGCGAGSAQEKWLRAELAAHRGRNVLAYWHHPRFSSGFHGGEFPKGTNRAVEPLWRALYEYGADVVLNGHDHDYERFAPQDPSGRADARYGIRQFVVGTGGASLRGFGTPIANSEVRSSDTRGVLKLTLRAASYDWEFIPEPGRTFADSGTGSTHGTPTDRAVDLLGPKEIGAQALPDLGFADAAVPGQADARARHVAVTGSDANPGTAARPWRTIGRAAKMLRAGQVAYVHAGTYGERITTAEGGTAAAPIRLMEAPGERVVIRGGTSGGPFIRVTKPYWIVSGFEIDARGSPSYAVAVQRTDHVLVREIDAHHGIGPAAVSFHEADDAALVDSRVHEYTWREPNGAQKDSHGVSILPGSDRVLIRANDSWGNSGDSVQCVGGRDGSDVEGATPTDITIENNRYGNRTTKGVLRVPDRENAVDIKTCHRVTIRGNKLMGYRPAGTAPGGAAVVAHANADGVLLEQNRFWDNGLAASIGSRGNCVDGRCVGKVVFRRNLVFDASTAKAAPPWLYPKAASGPGAGIRIGPAVRAEVYHNTFYNVPKYAVRLGDDGRVDRTTIINNIFANDAAGGTCGTDSTGASVRCGLDVVLANTPQLVSDRNLFRNARVRANGQIRTMEYWRGLGYDRNSVVADPLFVDDPRRNDFYTKAGSPARDVAIDTGAPYCDAGPDIGFLETCGSPSPSPGKLSIAVALAISPAHPATGPEVKATYAVENTGGQAVTIPLLLVGARDPSGANVDFPAVGKVTLQRGERYTYEQSRSFSAAGTYTAWPAYFDGGSWVELGERIRFEVQSSSTAGLTCAGSRTLESLASCIAGQSGPFIPPSTAALSEFGAAARSMLGGACETISLGPNLAGSYRVGRFPDGGGKGYCVMMEVGDSDGDGKVDKGWGAFVVNPSPARELNVAIPHTIGERSIVEQGIGVFEGTESRSFLLAGSGRELGGPSPCQGRFGYEASDPAHNTAHPFFAATRALDAWYGGRPWTQLQFHGMAAASCGSDVHMTYGIKTPPAPGDAIRTLKSRLAKLHPTWVVTLPGDSTACALDGTTNTEGRLLNGVPAEDCCTKAATSYSGRFVHIEQDPLMRNASHWVQPIVETWPEVTSEGERSSVGARNITLSE